MYGSITSLAGSALSFKKNSNCFEHVGLNGIVFRDSV